MASLRKTPSELERGGSANTLKNGQTFNSTFSSSTLCPPSVSTSASGASQAYQGRRGLFALSACKVDSPHMAMYQVFEQPRSVLLEYLQVFIYQEYKVLEGFNQHSESQDSGAACPSCASDTFDEQKWHEHMNNLSNLIKEYDDLLARSRALLAFEQPSRKGYESHQNLVKCHVDKNLQEALLGPRDDYRLLYATSAIEMIVADSVVHGLLAFLWPWYGNKAKLGESASRSFPAIVIRVFQEAVVLLLFSVLLVLPISLLVFLSLSLTISTIIVLLYGLGFSLLVVSILPAHAIDLKLLVVFGYTAGMVGFLGNLASKA